MGIFNLKSILIDSKNYLNVTKFKNCEDYSKLIESFGGENFHNFLILIDFSVMTNQILFSNNNNNLTECINIIVNQLNILNNNNNRFLFFIDPKTNLRKTATQQERIKNKNNLKNKLEDKIKKRIENNLNDFENQISLEEDYEVNSIINDLFNKDKLDFDQYVELANKFLENQSIYLNKSQQKSFSLLQDELLKNFKTFNFDENELFFKEDKIVDNLIKNDINDLFRYFIYKFPFIYHNSFLLNIFKLKGIIKDEEIIYSKTMDAEAYIIKYISKNNLENKKIIILSNDQDVLLLFSSNFKSEVFYILEYLNTKTDKIIINNLNNLYKNISLLAFMTNKSDYFKGVYNIEINYTNLQKIKNFKKLFDYDFQNNLESLLLTFIYHLYFKQQNIKKYQFEKLNKEILDNWFFELKNYLSLDKNFYLKKINFETIKLNDLFYYFKLNQNKILIYKNKHHSFIDFVY